MKNFKRIILMISMFAITGASVNCSFRSKLLRRSCRLRNIGQLPLETSTNLSCSSRSTVMRSRRQLTKFTNLTEHDSEQIISVLNGNHEKQAEFSGDFEEFLRGPFIISNDSVISFDMQKIANILTPSTNFDQLRLIYLDSILANIEFIKNLFEDFFFLELKIKSLSGIGSFYILSLPLANFLRSNLFENCFEAVSIFNGHLNIDTPEKDLFVYHDYSDHVMNGFMFNFKIEKELDGLEDISDFLQIDYNFIIECFIRDVENKDLKSIERFVEFVSENVEEDRATEIFYRCLRILNPERYETIIERLSNVRNGALSLRYLNITIEQLALLLPHLGKFTDLMFFDVSNNQLIGLPESIGNLINLIWLNLSNNQLTELPESIGNLINLVSLSFSNNQLRELPAGIGSITRLTYLYLDGNQLSELSTGIGSLTMLTYLNFSGNQLTELPAEIGSLTMLTYLNFSGNQLTGLPESIGNLTGLIYLRVSNNQLTELPESIGNLTNLTSLNLDNNQLTELPESIGNLINLGSLDLRYTFIEVFNRDYQGRQVVQGFMNSYFNR